MSHRRNGLRKHVAEAKEGPLELGGGDGGSVSRRAPQRELPPQACYTRYLGETEKGGISLT